MPSGYYRRFGDYSGGWRKRGTRRYPMTPSIRYYNTAHMEGTHIRLQNRAFQRNTQEWLRYGRMSKQMGTMDPFTHSVRDFWKAKRRVNAMNKMTGFHRIKYRAARGTGKIAAYGSLYPGRTAAIAGAGVVGLAGGTYVLRRRFKKRRASRRNAAHGYRNTPPELTTQQRRQMARRRRRVRGRFA